MIVKPLKPSKNMFITLLLYQVIQVISQPHMLLGNVQHSYTNH